MSARIIDATRWRRGCWRRRPHPRCNLAFFLSQGIEVNRRRRHAGVAEPALHEVERHAGSDRMNSEAMPEPLRRHVRTFRNGCGVGRTALLSLSRSRPVNPYTTFAATSTFQSINIVDAQIRPLRNRIDERDRWIRSTTYRAKLPAAPLRFWSLAFGHGLRRVVRRGYHALVGRWHWRRSSEHYASSSKASCAVQETDPDLSTPAENSEVNLLIACEMTMLR
jgi:hypothetical protein